MQTSCGADHPYFDSRTTIWELATLPDLQKILFIRQRLLISDFGTPIIESDQQMILRSAFPSCGPKDLMTVVNELFVGKHQIRAAKIDKSKDFITVVATRNVDPKFHADFQCLEHVMFAQQEGTQTNQVIQLLDSLPKLNPTTTQSWSFDDCKSYLRQAKTWLELRCLNWFSSSQQKHRRQAHKFDQLLFPPSEVTFDEHTVARYDGPVDEAWFQEKLVSFLAAFPFLDRIRREQSFANFLLKYYFSNQAGKDLAYRTHVVTGLSFCNRLIPWDGKNFKHGALLFVVLAKFQSTSYEK
jgi:hypothetical protein